MPLSESRLTGLRSHSLRSLAAFAGAWVCFSPVDPGFAQTPLPSGNEFQINSATGGRQTRPAVSEVGTAGDFVVTWRSGGGSSYNIFAQRLASDGTPLGAEFQVNSYATGNQGYQSVSGVGTTGRFVVAWHSPHDGSYRGIFAQRFSPGGTPLGPTEFQANTFTTSYQDFPSVAGIGTAESFVIVWNNTFSQDGSGFGVFGQRFFGNGAPLGSEFQVNTYTTGSQLRPSASGVGTAGDFVVAWADNSQDGGGIGVFAQRFASTGAKLGPELQANSYTTGNQSNPEVSAVGTDGSFVVVWSSYGGQDGSSAGVFGQRFGSNGARLGSEFQANSFTNDFQARVAVAGVGTAGDFVVSWASVGQDGHNTGVFAQRFNSDGTAQGSEFQVNSHTSSNQTFSTCWSGSRLEAPSARSPSPTGRSTSSSSSRGGSWWAARSAI